MKFGVFDHMDDSGVPITEHFENRLRIVEAYDRCGIHGYHVAEHHCTPLGVATSPSVFLSAVAQRTTRLKIGPLIFILPLYNPLRLLEEIGMLDNLSNGRLMLGMGRGISPVEAGYYGIPSSEMHERYVEASEIILKGLQQEILTYEGKYFSYKDVPMTLPPVQKPYPEIWYGGRTPESFEWAAGVGANIVTLALDEEVRVLSDIYKKTWLEAGKKMETLPHIGVSRHIVVAPTDREAKDIAASAYETWLYSFRKLWVEKGLEIPLKDIYPDSWEELEALGNGCAGSPDTVLQFALDEIDRGGINYMVSWFAFGNMNVDHTIRSIELFSERVMTEFKQGVAA